RGGDFEALVGLLDPDVVRRGGFGASHPALSVGTRDAAGVARAALRAALLDAEVHPVLVNEASGAVVTLRTRPFAVMSFSMIQGKIVEIDVIADPERVGRMAAAILTGQ